MVIKKWPMTHIAHLGKNLAEQNIYNNLNSRQNIQRYRNH